VRVDRLCCLVIALWLHIAVAGAEGKTPEYRGLTLGSIAMDIPAAMHQRLKPLASYLTQELGRPISLRLSADMTKAVNEMAAGTVDIGYLSPVAYVNARATGNVRLLAKTVTRGRQTLRLMLVTRVDSKIRSVQDLVGKRFAFGDEAAILQRAVVVNAGIRMEQLGSYQFLGHFDNVARGVANGDFDAGILKDTAAFQWENKGLRILYASPELPPYNISAGPQMDEATSRAIQAALLRLNPAIPEHRTVITALDEGYDGFVAADDADYNIVRKLIRPFQN
jgi:phosphonate transport system substrate-binding protein